MQPKSKLLILFVFLSLTIGSAVAYQATRHEAVDQRQADGKPTPAPEQPSTIELRPAGNLPNDATPQSHESKEAPQPNALSDIAAASHAADDNTATITLDISGLKSKIGELRVAVFDASVGFPDQTKATYTTEFALAESTSFTLKPLPTGTYSIAAYHDKNSDDTMNKGAFGIPSEAYGFSNNARATFGPPSFESANITLASGDQTIAIKLK